MQMWKCPFPLINTADLKEDEGGGMSEIKTQQKDNGFEVRGVLPLDNYLTCLSFIVSSTNWEK